MGMVYLIRHGQAEGNEARRYLGVFDQPLSDVGRWQASRLGARFGTIDVSRVFSSPATRARETALRVAERKGLCVEVVENLHEVDFGPWEGVREADVIAAYGGYEHYPDFLNYPDRYPAPGEQWFSEAQPRICECVSGILSQCPKEDIAIVSHLNTIKLLIMAWFHIDDHDAFPLIMFDNTSISAVRVDGARKELQCLNDTAHLLVDWGQA